MGQEPAHHTGARTPEPLTDEWLEWVAARLSGRRVRGAEDLVVQHRVVDADGSEFCWHLRLTDGLATVGAGPAAESGAGASQVTFTSDRETARAIAADGESAQRAFLEGRLRISGDARALISARPAFEVLSAALA